MSEAKPNLAQIKQVVEKTLGPLSNFVYLLGSAGTERFHAESDIDLAAHFTESLNYEKLRELTVQLETAFERDVDLVNLNDADPIFSHQVLKEGRLVYEANPEENLAWRVKQMSLYPDFKRSRKVIEDSLLNRKKYV